MSMVDPVKAYYSSGVELRRFETYAQLEALRIRRLLQKLFSGGRSRVLDVGSGSGIWASYVEGLGHEVFAVDLLPAHAHAERARGLRASIADACRLPFRSGVFDSVLLMGPLYHILDGPARLQALAECRRVVSKDGMLVATAISRYALVFQGWARGLDQLASFTENERGSLATGHHRNIENAPGLFTESYLHKPNELGSEITGSGWNEPEIRTVQGFGQYLPNLDEILSDPFRRDHLLESLELLESESDILSLTGHLIAIATAV